MTILFLILGISFLILLHEFGHFLAARNLGLLVEEFGIGFPPRLFGKKIGETLWSVNLLPFGGFVKIHGERPERETHARPVLPERSFAHLSIGRRAQVIGAGVVMNFFAGWLCLSFALAAGFPQSIVITAVSPGSPAEAAGFAAGDRILDFETSADFIAFVDSSRGTETAIRVLRGNETRELFAIPRAVPPPGEGALGIALADAGAPPMPVLRSLWIGFLSSFRIMGAILVALGGLVVGLFTAAPVLENFVGPVGIVQVAEANAAFGFVYLLELLGLISLNLTILNILPIPTSDGGRLLFLLIEKIKGTPLPAHGETAANAVGFVLLVLLMVLVTARDIVRLF